MNECLGGTCHSLPTVRDFKHPTVIKFSEALTLNPDNLRRLQSEEYMAISHRHWETWGGKGKRKKGKGKEDNKGGELCFLVYLLQLPLFGLVATCSFLPFSHIVPLSSRGEHSAVLPVHRQLQLQQVQRGAAARLEQRRGRRAFTTSRLRCRGARLTLHGGLWGFRGWREAE